MNKKNEDETQRTLAEAMSLRFAASLMAFSTFFSSLRTSAETQAARAQNNRCGLRAARVSRTTPDRRSSTPNRRSDPGRARARDRRGNNTRKKRKRPGEDRRTLDAAVEAEALVAEAALPLAQLLPRRRPRLQQALEHLHLRTRFPAGGRPLLNPTPARA